jgi:hypothetical protein
VGKHKNLSLLKITGGAWAIPRKETEWLVAIPLIKGNVSGQKKNYSLLKTSYTE